MPLRCLIVDDSRRFLKAAQELLEREGISVVGVASTAPEAHLRCSELRPDVALVDVDLGGDNGIELARQLTANCDGALRMILISAYSGDDFIDLIGPGAALPFLAKSELSGAAIRRIVADGTGGQPAAGGSSEQPEAGGTGGQPAARGAGGNRESR
ncbi:MAG: response regulator [Actinobacteria bacterium]|nr:response regulator [Actinomycetota bacterium]